MIQLKFTSKHQRYKVDEIRTFKGILRLNANNVQELNYILEEVKGLGKNHIELLKIGFLISDYYN
jgi:hypothetical protein